MRIIFILTVLIFTGCASVDKAAVDPGLLASSGIDPETVHIAGMDNSPEFKKVVIKKNAELNIEKMKPLTKIAHYSAGQAKYALEMNAGWFAERNIVTGDQMQGL